MNINNLFKCWSWGAFLSTLGAIGTVIGLYTAWNAFKYSLIVMPRNLTILNSEWDEIYTFTLTNNKDYPLHEIQIHLTCDDKNFDVDNIQIRHDSKGGTIKLGDQNNYYTIDHNLILFTCMSTIDRKKYRILRINSLEPHSTQVFILKFITNRSNKAANIRTKIGSFSKTPFRITEKENDVAMPFLLDKKRLWLRITLDKNK